MERCFVGGVLALQGTSVIYLQFKHLMSKALEELLGPTEKLEILFPHYSRSLHIAATLQSPHSHDPKCSEPLFTPPPFQIGRAHV